MRKFPNRLLLSNRAWSASRRELRTNYFESLAEGQTPQALWIGCSDSRVPAEEITGARPGELFVHRNIANVVRDDDFSMEGVLFYSLLVLKVKHIIVCGHSGCGGIQAAFTGVDQKALTRWLEPVRGLIPSDQATNAPTPKLFADTVRANVGRAVSVLQGHPIVQSAWEAGTLSTIQGWVYDLESGELDPAYQCDSTSADSLRLREKQNVEFIWR